MPDPATYRPAPGSIPEAPGRLPLLRRPRPRHLRGQGEEPAPTPELLLRRPVRPAPAHPADGHDGRARPVDGRRHRSGGAPARVQLDQGVRSAVQRPLPRRQDLPGARGDDERGVPAAARLPRAPPQRRALLRALRPRVGDPRDARPPPPRVPRAHLQRRGVQAARPDRPPLPARLHRQVLRPLRRAGRRRRAPRASSRTSATSWRAAPTTSSGSWSDGWRRRRKTSSSRRRPACATTSAPSAAPWSARPSCSAAAPTPTWSRSPTTSWRPRSRSSTYAADGCAASAGG